MRIKKLVATLAMCCMVGTGLTACSSAGTSGDGEPNHLPQMKEMLRTAI